MAGNLERKIMRNKLRKQYGNKKMKREFKIYELDKHGIANYAKMQKKSVKNILEKELD